LIHDASNTQKINETKDMKQVVLAFALMLTLSATTMSAAAQRHRHHPRVTMTTSRNDSVSNSQVSVSATDPRSGKNVSIAVNGDDPDHDEGVEAYSDTTYTDPDSSAVTSSYDDYDDHYTGGSDADRFYEFINHLGKGGAVLFILSVMIGFIAFLLAPIIIIVMILRYLIKRHNDKVALAEKAMETGRPIPEHSIPLDKQSDEYLWKRGIRNAAIGLGLMLMFWFWGADPLAGIGALVGCYGIGQAFLGRDYYRNKDKNGRCQDRMYETPYQEDRKDVGTETGKSASCDQDKSREDHFEQPEL
jgi:hypothetical protein